MADTGIARVVWDWVQARSLVGLNRRIVRTESGHWSLLLLPVPTRRRVERPTRPDWVASYVRSAGTDPGHLRGLDAVGDLRDAPARAAATVFAELAGQITLASAYTAVHALAAVKSDVGLTRDERKLLEDAAAYRTRVESTPDAVRDRRCYAALLDDSSDEIVEVGRRVVAALLEKLARFRGGTLRRRATDGLPDLGDDPGPVIRLVGQVQPVTQRTWWALDPFSRQLLEDDLSRVTLEAAASLHETFGPDPDRDTVERWVVRRLRWRLTDAYRAWADRTKDRGDETLDRLPGATVGTEPGIASGSELDRALAAIGALRSLVAWEAERAVEIIAAVLPVADPPEWAGSSSPAAYVRARWTADGAAARPAGAVSTTAEDAARLVEGLLDAAVRGDDLEAVLAGEERG